MSPAIALGFVIVGCAPASNVITYLAGGAVAFSIAMTMVATILSPLLTPMLVESLGGAFLEIPFWPMMQTILMIVVAPLFLGMWFPRLGSYGASAEVIAPGIAAIAIMIICSYAVAANQERIAEISIWLVLLVVMLNGLGYLFGWSAATLFNFDQRHKITMSIEIGMQNAGLGVALALNILSRKLRCPGHC